MDELFPLTIQELRMFMFIILFLNFVGNRCFHTAPKRCWIPCSLDIFLASVPRLIAPPFNLFLEKEITELSNIYP